MEHAVPTTIRTRRLTKAGCKQPPAYSAQQGSMIHAHNGAPSCEGAPLFLRGCGVSRS
jgi:hypothetical protein